MENDNLTSEANACPRCGERDTDNLIWVSDEEVQCYGCGQVYRPGADERPIPSPHVN